MAKEIAASGNLQGGESTTGRVLSLDLHTAAVDFLTGAAALSGDGILQSRALLAGQSLECALKSAIASKLDWTEDDLKRKVGHDLIKAWKQADLGMEMPRWVKTLNGLHDRPFRLRYRGAVLVLPASKEPMISELSLIVETCRRVVYAKP